MLKEINAIKQVVPKFDSDPVSEMKKDDGLVIYPVSKQNQSIGYAIKTYTDKGFGGHIELMTGFLPDGSIINITVLQHKETPGLGTKMTEPKFKNQFIGKNPESYSLKVKKDGGDVDAITAATVSSRAFCDALQRAYDALKQVKDSVTLHQ
jgi:electron transport complex protein RnfG